jgi:hypothetical protein
MGGPFKNDSRRDAEFILVVKKRIAVKDVLGRAKRGRYANGTGAAY